MYSPKGNNIDENKWLLYNNIFEYLTDSKVIIRVDLSKIESSNHLIGLLSTLPLNELVFNDSSSHKIILSQYLLEQNIFNNTPGEAHT